MKMAGLSRSVVMRLTNRRARLVATVNPTFSHIITASLFAYRESLLTTIIKTMDTLALVSVLGLAAPVIHFTSIGERLLETSNAATTQRTAQKKALVNNYGAVVGVPVSLLFGNTATQYLRIQRSVLNGKDEDAVQFRQAVTNECNMTAIAVILSSQLLILPA